MTEVLEPGGQRLLQKRIFANHSSARFSGRIHEQLVHPRDWPSVVTDIEVFHWGYADKAEARKKAERNLGLIKRELDQNPDDFYLLYQAGKTLLGQSRPDQAARFLTPIVKKGLGAETNPEIFGHAHLLLARALSLTGRAERAEELLERLVAARPDYAPANLALGRALYQAGRFQAAADALEACLDGPDPGLVVEHDPVQDRFLAGYTLAQCLMELGRPEEAAARLEAALDLSPQNAAAPSGPWPGPGATMAELLIAIFADGPAFDGHSDRTGALGGSETAVIQAARALSRLGHRVRVYNNCPAPGDFDGVLYFDKSALINDAQRTTFDVLIVSRYYNFLMVPVRARLKVLWNHDTLDTVGQFPLYLPRFDLMFNLSRFHLENYLTKVPAAAPKAVITRNGLDFDQIDTATAGVQKANTVIYVSRPERGLEDLLTRIWPRIRDRFPGLSLEVCGYDPGPVLPRVAEIVTRVKSLMKSTPGVVDLGPLAKADYYFHLARARALLYPCTFPEISCIAVLEAQACLTPIVTTADYALVESVGPRSYLVFGQPGTDAYVDAFVDRAGQLLTEKDKADRLARAAREYVEQNYAWPKIAAQWQELFWDRLSNRAGEGPAGE